jgi:uncharacterized protein YbjT (DUF2867 family)
VILVTTAGKVGAEAVRSLTLREVPVRVLARNPEKTKALADAGAEIAVGDLDAPASIDQAMAGVTAVVLVSPGMSAQELNVVASAARAGVEHVVKATSNASADSPIAPAAVAGASCHDQEGTGQQQASGSPACRPVHAPGSPN